MRLAIVTLAMATGVGFTASQLGCAHPYSGKAEKISKPRKKKRPEATEEEVADAPELDEKCRTNFFLEPNPRRKRSQGRNLARQGGQILEEAYGKEGAPLIGAIKDALSKLTNSLEADPYGPDATYKMAVAYAMVGKKGCSIDLLKRLNELTKMPEVAEEAERTIRRALSDQSFDIFRKDADAALGR